jgi:ElaB/YqjD/DUF883 family membrane-anchored ribosome-binding protein
MGKGATVMSEYERQNRELAHEPTGREVGSEFEGGREKSPQMIEREIEETRSRLSRDIDELGNRLTPHNLKEEAKSAIKGAAQGAVSNVGEQARRTGTRLVEVIRENPLPVIAVGAGVTWLLTQRSRSDISGDRMARFAYTGPERRQGHTWQSGSALKDKVGGAVSGVKESVSEAASGVAGKASELKERAEERMGELGGRARWQSRRIKTNLEHQAEENPLIVAIGATVLGLALGLLLPRTERENELMGPARDQLMDRAENAVERAKETAVEAGREVKETVKAEIQERKPEIKEAVQQAGETVKEQVKDSARRVKNEAKAAAKQSPDNPRSTR